MSLKLKEAVLKNKVSIYNDTSGEVMISYLDRDQKRRRLLVPAFQTRELVPKLTDTNLLIYSNLDMLIKRRAVKVM